MKTIEIAGRKYEIAKDGLERGWIVSLDGQRIMTMGSEAAAVEFAKKYDRVNFRMARKVTA